eukprot:1134810-Pelagomonas_calceolata.AAC.1
MIFRIQNTGLSLFEAPLGVEDELQATRPPNCQTPNQPCPELICGNEHTVGRVLKSTFQHALKIRQHPWDGGAS